MLDDKGDNGEDLTGGYFDAGDLVKFGFPMAYAMTVVGWGVVDYEATYEKIGEHKNALSALRWGADYFLKAHTKPTEFYGQVGKGGEDHASWNRPEDWTAKRPAYKVDAAKPGSDLVGETAAALAVASIAFKKSDAAYSAKLLTAAESLFKFANEHRGKYSDSIADVHDFYNSWSGFGDELAWAAAWLYRATNNKDYLKKSEELAKEFKLLGLSPQFGWDDKTPGVQILLAKLTGEQVYKDAVAKYTNNLRNVLPKSPKGLVVVDKWGPARHAANAAFMTLQAAEIGIAATENKAFAKKQIDYLLGDGGHSFVVGVGKNPPQKPHHRASSCPDRPAKCDWNAFNNAGPNPQVLTGALVGGPDDKDAYTDKRDDYVHNEVAMDYNAAFQSALAALARG